MKSYKEVCDGLKCCTLEEKCCLICPYYTESKCHEVLLREAKMLLDKFKEIVNK